MKKLKFTHKLAEAIRSGQKTSSWRIYDDKNLSVNDYIELIDTVNPGDPTTWVTIGTAVIESVAEKRLDAITEKDYIGHETYDSDDAMLTTMRKYYGPQVTLETPVKIIQFKLVDSNHLNVVENATYDLTEIKLFSDGGSRGNPGPSACGFVLFTMADNIIVEQGFYLGVTTNNQAEYQGLKHGLEAALAEGAKNIHVYMDSMLVVNQMKGVFTVKNRDLWPIHGAVTELVTRFNKVTFAHVPRELNKRADQQVNDVLDAQIKNTS